MIFLKPIDDKIMQEVAASGTPVITVEDASVKGGLGAAADEWLSSRNISRSVTRIGVPDKFVTHGTVSQLYKLCGMDAEAISAAIVGAKNAKNIEK